MRSKVREFHDRERFDKKELKIAEDFAIQLMGQYSSRGRLSNLNLEIKKLCNYIKHVKEYGFIFANDIDDVIHMKDDIRKLVEVLYYEIECIDFNIVTDTKKDFTQVSNHIVKLIKDVNFSWLHYYFFKQSLDCFLSNKSISADAYNSEEKQFYYVCVLHYIDNIIRLSILGSDRKDVTGVNTVKNSPIFNKVSGKSYDLMNGVYRSETERLLYKQTVQFCIDTRRDLNLDSLDDPDAVLLVDLNDLVDDSFRYIDTESVCISVINDLYGLNLYKPQKSDFCKCIKSNESVRLDLENEWVCLERYRNKLLEISVDSETISKARVIVLDKDFYTGLIISWYSEDGSVRTVMLNRGLKNNILSKSDDLYHILTCLALDCSTPKCKIVIEKEIDLIETKDIVCKTL